MAFPPCPRHWLAGVVSCAFFMAVSPVLAGAASESGKTWRDPEVKSNPGQAWRDPGAISKLTQRLEAWLDDNSPYPRRAEAVSIRFVESGTMTRLAGRPSRSGQQVRGYYDPAGPAIYLASPWSMGDVRDAGVLLHELVHHRQQTAGHWYCPGAQELPAYRLQAAWLAENRVEARINWIAVVLEAGCAPRDIHPD